MIYLVIGETGDYSDYMTWTVKAFTTKKLADDYCEQLNQAKHKRIKEGLKLDGKYAKANCYGVEEVELVSE